MSEIQPYANPARAVSDVTEALARRVEIAEAKVAEVEALIVELNRDGWVEARSIAAEFRTALASVGRSE